MNYWIDILDSAHRGGGGGAQNVTSHQGKNCLCNWCDQGVKNDPKKRDVIVIVPDIILM